MRNSLPPPPLPNHALEGSVAATVRALAPGVRPSDIWRSAAFTLLRLNPKECEALATVFEDEAATDDRRVLVLDLLAGAGSFEAQVVIRRLLALQVARRDSRQFTTFVQRLAIVESPDGPTLRFLMSVYAESRNEVPEVRAACAYALGAASGQAFAGGDPDAAVRASDVLRRDLLSVGAPLEKSALVTALGNAGVPSDAMVITRFTVDPDPSVRCAAALALRKLNLPEARTQLIGLVADRDPKVAQSALAALTEHKLDDEELERLSELVLDGRTPMALDLRVLRLIVAQRPRIVSVPGRACLVENALRLLLGRVEAQASVEGTAGTGSGERRVAFPPPTNFGSITPPAAARQAAMKMTTPQQQYVHHTPLPYSPNESQVVGAMNAPAPMPVIPRGGNVPTVLGHALAPTPEGGVASALPDTRRAVDAPNEVSPTVLDQPPIAGTFRLVNPGDTVETVRARMIEMGLDPNASLSIIPQPPRRADPKTQLGVGPALKRDR